MGVGLRQVDRSREDVLRERDGAEDLKIGLCNLKQHMKNML